MKKVNWQSGKVILTWAETLVCPDVEMETIHKKEGAKCLSHETLGMSHDRSAV